MILESVGTASPPHGLTQEDRQQLAEQFVTGDQRDRWFVENIIEKSTIQKRPSVLFNSSVGNVWDRQSLFLPITGKTCYHGPTTAARMQAYEKYAGKLALAACEDALQHSQINANEITHTVTASCTGFSAPGFDLELVSELPLAQTVKRTHLGFMGCHAGLNCLRVADAIAKAESQSRVLVCCTELCTLHYQYSGTPDQIVANSLFADGSGAAIVTSEPRTDTQQNWEIAGNCSYIVPETSEMMEWKIEDHGFTMKLSDRIPELIKQHACPQLSSWLATFDLSPEDINGWAIHPGGPQILNAFEIAMSLPSHALQRSRDLLRSRGNMSSASFFFLLNEFRKSSNCLPCLAVGFGPGLTIEAALFV